MGAPVATFSDTMAEIIYELDDREIYNDIRSEIDVTDTQIIVDTGAEYDTYNVGKYISLSGNETKSVTLYSREGDRSVTWVSAQAYGYFGLDSELKDQIFGATITSSTSTSVTIEVTNPFSTYCPDVHVWATYSYLVSPETTHEESLIRTLQVRGIDNNSIAKYGRRVMNLTWPLGQTEAQMQSFVDKYCDRYSEPVARVTMTLLGDTLITQILTRKISEKITVVNTRLGLNTNFYINAIDISHDASGLLEAKYTLEAARILEGVGFFILDTSALDGTDVLGWGLFILDTSILDSADILGW